VTVGIAGHGEGRTLGGGSDLGNGDNVCGCRCWPLWPSACKSCDNCRGAGGPADDAKAAWRLVLVDAVKEATGASVAWGAVGTAHRAGAQSEDVR
jgi:hypothetical protein